MWRMFRSKCYLSKHFATILILCLLTVFFFPDNTLAASEPDINHLRIGVAGNPPFVMNGTERESGIAYEIWDAVADGENWDYSLKRYNTVAEALDALNKDQLDLVVGPVSITSDRVKTMDFSQPFYYSGLSIMSRRDEPGLYDRISPFFSIKLLIAILVFLSILAVVGSLIWLAERRRSPEQFPPDMPHGIANGMWLAVVTMSTTGYGDRAPVTFWGRIIAGAWMIISIIFATTMVAGIASTLTLSGMGSNTITEARQLSGKQVATPSLSIAKSFLDEFQAKAVGVRSLEEAYGLLESKKVSAIVFDRPQLLYFEKKHPAENIIIGPSIYEPTGYGFAFPMKSPLIKKINIRMLKLTESGDVNRIVKSWLDNGDQ